MDAILELLLEFIVTVLAEVIGELLFPLIALIAVGVGAYTFWPYGLAPHVATGCLIVAISLIGAGVVMWRDARSRREAMSRADLNDQARSPDQGSCRPHHTSPTPSSTASPTD